MDRRHDLVGTTFHGITLLAYCGGGAFGDVYYGKDVTGRGLAVKIVSKARLGDHWERELKGVVQYRRITEDAPQLLKIFHVEDTGGEFFYTMEPADSVSPDSYVPDTLAKRLGKGAIPPDELFGILSGIFSGIRAIHEAGFAHRDIKPENILFVNGIPKLGDIGLLSSLSGSMTTLAGTLEYIPPEMRTADRSDTDRASRRKNDLYAFGKVVYCAVTGEDAGRWPELPPTLPAVLPVKLFLRLALRLCSKDPVRRIDSVAELGREFAEIEHQLEYGETWRDRVRYRRRELFSGARGALYGLGRGVRRYWYAALIALAAVAGTVWYMRPAKPFDVTAVRNKKFEWAAGGIEMTIPVHWEPISRETLLAYLAEQKANAEISRKQKKQIALFEVSLSMQKDFCMIFCNAGDDFNDNITLYVRPPGKDKMYDLPDDRIRFKLKNIMLPLSYGPDAVIYDLRRSRAGGHPCVYVDCGPRSGMNRGILLYWEFSDHVILMEFAAGKKTFEQRRQEFESVLKTLKIRKKL